jgi:hypothetical protein
VLCNFVDVLALGVQAWEVRGIHVVAALFLELKDELDLALLSHAASLAAGTGQLK